MTRYAWRTTRYAVALIVATCSAAPALAETRVFFSSQESVEQKLVQLIDQSRSSIEMALFELRSPGLSRALERAQGRGVQLRLVLDASHREGDLPEGSVRWLGGKTPRGRGVMHNKFALFDQGCVVTGSYNWTPGAEYSNYENALLTDDPDTVKAYAGEFETLWERAIQGSVVHSPFHHHLKQQRLKTIRIKIPKAVTKHKHKTHTGIS